VLDALLDPCDIPADRVEASLDKIEPLGQLMMAVAQPLDTGIRVALLGDQRLETDLLVADDLLALADLVIQRLPAQG
jgi:hypothetical protein